MEEKELILLINKQVETDISEDSSMQVLREKLVGYINDLIQNNFQKLVTILYRVDVDENKLKRALKEDTGKNAADIIVRLIIEREVQKIESRRLFGRK